MSDMDDTKTNDRPAQQPERSAVFERMEAHLRNSPFRRRQSRRQPRAGTVGMKKLGLR